MAQCRIDRIERGVAIGGVDERVKGGGKGKRLAKIGETEVGSRGLAVGGELAQCALEFASGGEDAGDAFEVREVGVVERVLAGYRAFAGICDSPRAEAARGVNCAVRARVGEVGDKVHGAIGAYVGEGEMRDGNLEGNFARLVGFKHHADAGALDCANLNGREIGRRCGCRRGAS